MNDFGEIEADPLVWFFKPVLDISLLPQKH